MYSLQICHVFINGERRKQQWLFILYMMFPYFEASFTKAIFSSSFSGILYMSVNYSYIIHRLA